MGHTKRVQNFILVSKNAQFGSKFKHPYYLSVTKRKVNARDFAAVSSRLLASCSRIT